MTASRCALTADMALRLSNFCPIAVAHANEVASAGGVQS